MGDADLRLAVAPLLDAAVAEAVTPGGVLLVADDGEVRMRLPFGLRQRAGVPTTLDTRYDLASLTKPLATACVTLRLIEAGRLALDTPAAVHVPELAVPERGQITVRSLLSHSSGLPAWRPFFEMVGGDDPRTEMVARAALEPLEYETNARSIYSDLGFMVLGAVVERAAGARLDELAASVVFRPLGLSTIGFVELARPERPAPVAPTELCPRRGLLTGEVHDDNCHAAGGILGHAGLFATADDVSAIAGALARSWRGERFAGSFPPALVQTFFAPAGVPGSTWRLGWDGPAERGSQAGELWSKRGVGHLGFTGCSLWIDLERARWVVLLTNRVHPSRDDRRILALRPALHDAVVGVLG